MFTSFRHAVTEVLATSLDITPGELLKMGQSLSHLAKNAEDPAPPARPTALADAAAVRALVQQKYPNLLKKRAMASAAETVFLSKEAEKLLSRVAKGLKSDKVKRFAEAAKAEFGPAAGAVLGAGLAHAYNVNPLAGAAAGYGAGAIPEIVHAIRHRGA